jgi:hypothetical protein
MEAVDPEHWILDAITNAIDSIVFGKLHYAAHAKRA